MTYLAPALEIAMGTPGCTATCALMAPQLRNAARIHCREHVQVSEEHTLRHAASALPAWGSHVYEPPLQLPCAALSDSQL